MCVSPCENCTGPTASECLSCVTNYTLASTTCNPVCVTDCATCSGPFATDCLTCNSNYELAGPSPNSCIYIYMFILFYYM